MFARTPRLTLRPGWPEDAPALVEAIAHESVCTMLARAPWPYTLEDAEAYLALPRDDHSPRMLILAHDGARPGLVGGIGLTQDESGHEFGYWLTPDAWGRGYATEAGRAVIDIARHALGLRHVHAGHFHDNPGSGRVLRKLGFRETGVAPRACRARGPDVAGVTYALELAPARAMPLAA
ncbi:GNAT family N-acetyltransferase [Sphingomonas sp. CARO-RG-8B-R24-01]|uniref:GNAT family N-acetyltransferase n=1 Tax=Sphingomonas sp. CARO-RG-8B-R24-01 TaxID=2914831 RepID=UPI001F56988B|nr:GNAT family N-acetyltransferase [Sphingomonas sp. CARO-RG-8B-R24-01]